MIGIRNIKVNNNEEFDSLEFQEQIHGQSPLIEQGQRQQDLQLLIRAHQKIRTLEQQNTRLTEEKQVLRYELQNEKESSKIIYEENQRLKLQIAELMQKIVRFEKKFDYSQQYELGTEGNCSEMININNNSNHNNNNNNENHKIADSQGKVSTDIEGIPNEILLQKSPSKLTEKQSERMLKQSSRMLQPSESTPVVMLDFNNNNGEIFSKEQRKQFLSSCKEEFAQQLQKINERVNNSSQKRLSRKGSQNLLVLEGQPNNIKAQGGYNGVKSFLREAQKQFEEQTLKTLKNDYYVDRKNCKQQSGSLVKRNFGKRFDNEMSKDKLGDRTNYVNSKYANANNQVISTNVSRNSYLTKSPIKNSSFRLDSTHDHNTLTPYSRDSNQLDSLLKKSNTTKNLYISNGQYSKYIYCSKDKRSDVIDRKRKQIDMQLRDNHGFIKYRGLCL